MEEKEKVNRLGILVISDRASRGEYADLSGPAIAEWASQAGFQVAAFHVVPDDGEPIQAKLKEWADELRLDLILTSGGTGLGPRDGTPETTLEVIERQVPGIPERIRAVTSTATPLAALSRAVAGIRGRTFIMNLPGSPKAVGEWLRILEPLLPHALAMMDGKRHEEAPIPLGRAGGSHA